jgi:hypothetical protein
VYRQTVIDAKITHWNERSQTQRTGRKSVKTAKVGIDWTVLPQKEEEEEEEEKETKEKKKKEEEKKKNKNKKKNPLKHSGNFMYHHV